jgi:hypothetical protein
MILTPCHQIVARKRDLIATISLCDVHRVVSPPEEGIDVFAGSAAQRDTDAASDFEFLPVDDDRDAHGKPSAFGDARSLGGVRQFFEHYDELVAANSCERVVFTQDRLEAPRDILEHEVARSVTERVVDALEVIDIAVEDRDPASLPIRARQRMLEPIEEKSPIRKAGHRIV